MNNPKFPIDSAKVEDTGEPDTLITRICDAIRAADNKSVEEHFYMLDSNDCIKIIKTFAAPRLPNTTPSTQAVGEPTDFAPLTAERRNAIVASVDQKYGESIRAAVDLAFSAPTTGSAQLTEEERDGILGWVSACQSAYHIDNTPGHRFGGLGSNLEENREGLIEFVESIVADRVALLAASMGGDPK